MATATAAASSSSSPARSSTSSCSAAAARHHRPSAGLSLAAVVRARPAMVALMAFAAMFWAHRALRAHYHAHCNGDLFRVLLFNQSNMCANIAGLIAVVELYLDAIRDAPIPDEPAPIAKSDHKPSNTDGQG